MRETLRVTVKIFARFSLIFGVLCALGFVIRTKDLMSGVMLDAVIGIELGALITIFMFISLVLFKARLLYYANIPLYLTDNKILMESPAGDACSWRIRHGGLFLMKESILFIPQKFALDQQLLDLPLGRIREVRKVGINLSKFFSGGLRERLVLKTVEGNEYQFSVLETDRWITCITAHRE